MYAKELKIPYFRGVFMRNALPSTGPHYRESAIINLDDASGLGTHWVAYRKRAEDVVYFDSFGDLQPPLDLMLYLGVDRVKYNHERYQNFDTYNCGHLCLQFLCNSLKRI